MNKKIWLVSMMVLALTLCATVALADVPTRSYNCPTHGVTYNKSCTYEYNNNGTHSVKRTACNEYVTPSPEDCIYAADSGVVTEPTCTEKGYTSYTCLYCGGVYKTDYTDPTGHVWAETATSDGNATCTADGTMSIHCTVCNAVDESTTVDEPDSALGHDWVVTYEWAKDHKSCTATRTCSRGDATETATTEAITKATTDATCTKDGAVVYTATFADTDAADWAKDTTDEVVIAKLGHWYGEWSPVADGTHTANCKR